jgi:hypothetical protein
LTCAACHTAAIKLGKDGPECLVEGGPSMVDFEGFLKALNVAIGESKSKPLVYTKTLLKSYLEPAWDTPYGYGRVDALGQIHNRLFKPKNETAKLPADAPVSYPHLWNTPDLSHVQWTAVASNEVERGPLGRNVGEALGVFGQLDILALSPEKNMLSKSSIQVEKLEQLEKWVKTLEAPEWPPQFGKLNQALADCGEKIYAENCIMCHTIWSKPHGNSWVKINIHKLGTVADEVSVNPRAFPADTDAWTKWTQDVASSRVGTDSLVANRSADRARLGSVFEDHLLKENDLLPLVSQPLVKQLSLGVPASVLLVTAVGLTINGKEPTVPFFSLLNPLNAFNFLSAIKPVGQAWSTQVEPQYRARPLNEIWATAPYLHNGSVPTLWDLLHPRWEPAGPIPDDSKDKYRPQTFQVGCREYDPVEMGFVKSCADKETFVFRTRSDKNDSNKDIDGNSNQGHLWGTQLERTDKVALLEYLKTL